MKRNAKTSSPASSLGSTAARFCTLLISLLTATSLSGCIVAGGYSSGGGWFFWPGSLGLLFMLLFVVFLLRRRR